MMQGRRLVTLGLLVSLGALTLGACGQEGSTDAPSSADSELRTIRVVLAAEPATVAFGDVATGQRATQRVTVTNAGASTVAIGPVRASGTGFSVADVQAATLAPGQSTWFTLAFAPAGTGAASGAAAVTGTATTRWGHQVSAVLSVPATGNGVSAGQGAVAASPATVAFGTVTLGATGTQALTLTNTGTAAVSIRAVTSSSALVQPSTVALPASLAPGQSTQVTLTYSPLLAGTTSGTLSVASDAPGSPLAVPFTATAATAPAARLVATPAPLAFGDVTVGNRLTRAVTVTNGGDAAATLSQASATGAFSAALPAPVSLGAGQSTTVQVTFAPGAAGAASGTLSLTSTAPGSPMAVALSGNGVAPAPATPAVTALAATTSPFVLGAVYTGQTRLLPVVVKNTSSATVTVASVTTSGAGLFAHDVHPATIAPGATAWLAVGWNPTAPGALAGTVTLKNSAGTTLLALPVSGSSAALDGTNSVSAAAYGARGDGATDDTAALQAAANAARDAGKVLVIPQPPGGAHYKLTRYVQVYGSVVGVGMPWPELRMYGATGADIAAGQLGPGPQTVLYYKGNASGTVITGLHINGGAPNPPTVNPYNVNVEHSTGLALQSVSNAYIENNLIENTLGDNIMIGGEAGSTTAQNLVVANNQLVNPTRCNLFPGDTNNLKVYLNTIVKLVEFQSAMDFEPNYAPQADWNTEVAYNNFDVTLQHDHGVLTSNTGNHTSPGGNINIHHNWGQAGAYSFYLNFVAAGTTNAWTGNTIQTSLPTSP